MVLHGRVASGAVTDSDVHRNDPLIGRLVLGWIALAAAGGALSAGLPWQRLLHWVVETLLVLGICLATIGISDARREWTTRQGWVATARARFWVAWNTLAVKSVAEALGLRRHQLPPVQMSATLETRFNVNAVLKATWVPSAGASYKERIRWLEERMTEASERFNKIVSAIAEVKKDVVDLARRAAASSLGRVTCLLAGTVLTAFY